MQRYLCQQFLVTTLNLFQHLWHRELVLYSSMIDMVIAFLQRPLMKHSKLCGLKYLLLKRNIFVVSFTDSTMFSEIL